MKLGYTLDGEGNIDGSKTDPAHLLNTVIDVSYSDSDFRQTTFGTIGEGDIYVDDELLSDDLLSQLGLDNRDLDNTQITTKDKSFRTGDLNINARNIAEFRDNVRKTASNLKKIGDNISEALGFGKDPIVPNLGALNSVFADLQIIGDITSTLSEKTLDNPVLGEVFLDPDVRKALLETYKALVDAGYSPDDVKTALSNPKIAGAIAMGAMTEDKFKTIADKHLEGDEIFGEGETATAFSTENRNLETIGAQYFGDVLYDVQQVVESIPLGAIVLQVGLDVARTTTPIGIASKLGKYATSAAAGVAVDAAANEAAAMAYDGWVYYEDGDLGYEDYVKQIEANAIAQLEYELDEFLADPNYTDEEKAEKQRTTTLAIADVKKKTNRELQQASNQTSGLGFGLSLLLGGDLTPSSKPKPKPDSDKPDSNNSDRNNNQNSDKNEDQNNSNTNNDATKILPKEIVDLAEANITDSGRTVLGPFPAYIEKAQAKGDSYFDIGDAWNKLTDEQRWAANKHFLDIITAKGDTILFAVPKNQIKRSNKWSRLEIDYLVNEKGYKWVNQWSLKPPASTN